MTTPEPHYNPGTTWLVTTRTAPAWRAALTELSDGPAPVAVVSQAMASAAGLAPRTIDNLLRSASRRGWISRRLGIVTLLRRDLVEADLEGLK